MAKMHENESAAEYGVFLCDGLGDGAWVDASYDIEFFRNLSFNILQSARMRTYKTDLFLVLVVDALYLIFRMFQKEFVHEHPPSGC